MRQMVDIAMDRATNVRRGERVCAAAGRDYTTVNGARVVAHVVITARTEVDGTGIVGVDSDGACVVSLAAEERRRSTHGFPGPATTVQAVDAEQVEACVGDERVEYTRVGGTNREADA